jgi:hypothetical protein
MPPRVPPPKPDQARLHVDVLRALPPRAFGAPPPRVDPERAARIYALKAKYRESILTRTAYLDEVAATFRFDHPLDAGLAARQRHWIEVRMAKVRELAAYVQNCAKTDQWHEAEMTYRRAEHLAGMIDNGLRLGRAESDARQRARQRARAGRRGTAAQQEAKAKILRAIEPVARAYRTRHRRASLAAIAHHLRGSEGVDADVAADLAVLSDRTICDYLRALSLK